MDNKQLIAQIANKLSMDYKETSEMVQAVNSSIVDILCQGDSIALPGFGTFSTIKEDETITRDLSTGRKILLPPHISIKFQSSAVLRKNI